MSEVGASGRRRHLPARLSGWLLLVSAMVVAGLAVWQADGPDVLLSRFVVVPWVLGPAALACLMARRVERLGDAWLFLILHAGLSGWTGWELATLFRYPDAQNGVLLLGFPILQYALALLLSLTWAVADIRRERKARKGS